MAIALVQDASNAGATTTSTTATLAGSPTNGNLLIACCVARSDRTYTAPTGFTLARDQQNTTTDTSHHDLYIHYKIASGDGTAYVFTIDNTGNLAGWVGEFSGAHASTPFDTASGQDGGTTSAGTTSITTAEDNELVVAVYGHTTTEPTSRSYTNSFAEIEHRYGTACGIDVATLIQTPAGSIACTESWTGSGNSIAAIAAFKVAAVAASVRHNLALLGVG